MNDSIDNLNFEEIEKIEEEEYTVEELAEMAADAELFYKKWGKKLLKLLIFKQLQLFGKMPKKDISETQELRDSRLAQGTINGFEIVQEWFKNKSNQSLSRHDKPEPETALGEIE